MDAFPVWKNPTPFDPARPLALLHIPKTGGTALTQALALAIQPRRHVLGWDRSLFGDYDDFASWPKPRLQHLYLSAADLPLGGDFLSSHIAASTISARYPEAQRLTVLREPWSRLLSLWIYWRGQTDDLVSQVGSLAERVRGARKPLAAFLDQPGVAAQTDNVATRMLLWPHPAIPNGGFISPRDDDAVLEEAMRRLETFDFVDIAENAALPVHLSRWLQRPVALQRENVTPPPPKAYRTDFAAELSPEARSRLRDRSRLDLALWQAVAAHEVGAENVPKLRLATRRADDLRFRALLAPEAAAAA